MGGYLSASTRATSLWHHIFGCFGVLVLWFWSNVQQRLPALRQLHRCWIMFLDVLRFCGSVHF